MPTIRWCPFCEADHIFRIQFDDENDTFELWCAKSGLRVERVPEKDNFERFIQLIRQFIPPPREYLDE